MHALTDLRSEVLGAFLHLRHRLSLAREALLNELPFPAWIEQAPNQASIQQIRFQAISVIEQLEYGPSQAPKETLLCAGIIAVSCPTLEAFSAVNEAKLQFKKAVLALKASFLPLNDPELNDSIEKALGQPSETRQTLRQLGMARLHLKQCYRKIPLLDKAPQKVSWTWAHTRAIQRITVEQAIKSLEKRGSDAGIMQQIARCAQLSPKEPLAIIQELAPHLRANLVFGDASTGVVRRMIKAPLPIFYPAIGDELPAYTPPKPKQEKDKQRVLRSDVKIDPNPFLPAIRAHRYL